MDGRLSQSAAVNASTIGGIRLPFPKVPAMSQANSRETTLLHSFGFNVWEGAIGRQTMTHVHAEVEWNFLLNGSARYFIAGRFVELERNRLAMFWGAMPHRLTDFAGGSRMIWATLPIAWLMEWKVGERLVHSMLSGALVQEPDLRVGEDDRVMLMRWAADLATRRWRLRMAVMLETQARLYRFAERMRGNRRPPASEPAQGKQVERITTFLARNFLEDISVTDVGQAVGLHPNYAMTLFRAACGMTLKEYITRLRVGHAQRLLLTTDQKITGVAMNSGFNTPSRFYEAFSKIAGKTPSAYKRATRVEDR